MLVILKVLHSWFAAAPLSGACMPSELNRREFLQAGGAVLALSLLDFSNPGLAHSARAAIGRASPRYEGFADVYREKWIWDKVVRGTHFVNCGWLRRATRTVMVR